VELPGRRRQRGQRDELLGHHLRHGRPAGPGARRQGRRIALDRGGPATYRAACPTPQGDSPVSKLSALERARACQRLAADGPAVPLYLLTGMAGVSIETLVRWIVQGRAGLHLDGYRDPVSGKWMSTSEALRRFLVASTSTARPSEPEPAA